MALALPLSILDASGTAKSIARFTDGNATPPKTLKTLGGTEGNTPPVLMSDWVGCVDANTVTTSQFFNSGQYSGNARRCSCFVYSPSLAAGQTWCVCNCWDAFSCTGSGGFATNCFRILCNGIAKSSCYVTNSFGLKCCSGTNSFLIDSNDVVVYVACTTGTLGSTPPTISRTQVCIHASFGNVNGTVTLGSPKCVAACTQLY